MSYTQCEGVRELPKMLQNTKEFSELLNRSLDELGAPIHIKERAAILSKMVSIPKQQAWAILAGHVFPSNDLLHKIADELEIDLSGVQKK